MRITKTIQKLTMKQKKHKKRHYIVMFCVDVTSNSSPRFPSSKYPVLAFQGAPGHFPSLQQNQHLQKYIYFSNNILSEANRYIKEVMGRKKYVAIHLRNGIDLVSALVIETNIFGNKYCKKLRFISAPKINNIVRFARL